MKNFEEKMRRKTFLKCVWLSEEKEKQIGGPICFLPKMERKLKRENRAA